MAFSWDAGTIVSYIYIVYSCEPLFGSFQTLGLVARSCAGRWAYNQQKDKVVSPLQIKKRRQGIPSVWGELCIEHEKALNEIIEILLDYAFVEATACYSYLYTTSFAGRWSRNQEKERVVSPWQIKS